MTTSLDFPRFDDQFSSLKRRISSLERQLADRLAAARPDTLFVLAGPLYATTSPPYMPPSRRTYAEVVVALGTALTAGTFTIQIKVNAVVIKSYSLGVAQLQTIEPTEIRVNSNERITATITSAGTGGKDLSLMLRT